VVLVVHQDYQELKDSHKLAVSMVAVAVAVQHQHQDLLLKMVQRVVVV
jgi:hypothetical protein